MEVWLNMAITQITEVNAITGEIVERQFNEQEKVAHDLLKAEAQAQAVIEAEKEVARQAVLDRLGLTADEAKLLLS